MPEMFIVIRGISTGPCHSFHQKQAAANAVATDNTNLVAHVGALEVGTLQPDEAYFNGTAIVSETAYEAVVANARSDTRKLKDASQALHDAYCALVSRLEDHALADYFKREHVNWAHDFLAYAHRGTRAVMMSDNLTTIQKLLWAQANGLGPTDVPPDNRPAFFEVVEDWDAETAIGSVPSEAIVFADPTDAARYALVDCKGNTASLADGVLADETDNIGDYIRGAWIADITA